MWRGAPKSVYDDVVVDIPNEVYKTRMYMGAEGAGKIADEMASASNAVSKELNEVNKAVSAASEAKRRASRELRLARKAMDDAEAQTNVALNAIKVKTNNIKKYKEILQKWKSLPEADIDPRVMSKIDDIERAIMREEELLGRAKSVVDSSANRVRTIEQTIQSNEESVAEKAMEYEKLLEKHSVLATMLNGIKTDPRGAISVLRANPQIFSDFSGFEALAKWETAVLKNIVPKSDALAATSKYINNDRKFVREYIEKIHPYKGAGNSKVQAWLLNPHNAQKLEELQEGNKFGKILLELKDPELAKRVSELSRKVRIDGLKRKGLAGAGIAGAGAVAYLTLFDENSGEAKQTINELERNSQEFTVTGEGRNIFNRAFRAAQAAKMEISRAEANMSRDPAKTIPTFTKNIAQHKEIIDDSLANWDLVVVNSNDINAARQAGKSLENVSNTIDKILSGTNNIASSGGKPLPGGIAGDIPRTSNKGLDSGNIKAIQNYLRNRFPTVAPTGRIDGPTEQALRQLAQELDASGQTGGKISGNNLLYRPGHHMILLNDLQKLEKMVR